VKHKRSVHSKAVPGKLFIFMYEFRFTFQCITITSFYFSHSTVLKRREIHAEFEAIFAVILGICYSRKSVSSGPTPLLFRARPKCRGFFFLASVCMTRVYVRLNREDFLLERSLKVITSVMEPVPKVIRIFSP